MNDHTAHSPALRRSWILTLVSLGVFALVLLLLKDQHESLPKFRIDLHRVAVNTSHLKPPLEENVFSIYIENFDNHDLWFVWSDSPDQPIPESSRYMSSGETHEIVEETIDCTKLIGHGTIHLIEFLGNGECENCFHAVLLKPGARLTCKRFPIVSSGGLDRLVVRVTPSLMVDGTTPLEEWLPFDPGNYGEILLDSSTYEFGSGLNRGTRTWKPGKGVADFRKMRLEYIEIKPVESYIWEYSK